MAAKAASGLVETDHSRALMLEEKCRGLLSEQKLFKKLWTTSGPIVFEAYFEALFLLPFFFLLNSPIYETDSAKPKLEGLSG